MLFLTERVIFPVNGSPGRDCDLPVCVRIPNLSLVGFSPHLVVARVPYPALLLST